MSMMVQKQGFQRAQLTLQEVQDLADRQRQQILYNSQEIMEKQKQLMRMHTDFKTRFKIQNGSQSMSEDMIPTGPSAPGSKQARISSPQSTTLSPSTPEIKPEKEQYARMLRQTYQNMGKMQNRNQLLHDLNIKKFTNIELGYELNKVRSIFASKQNELAEAVKKVDVLTHQLDSRRNSASGASVPTPERINRRKKIQAAKDEVDRLRNELIVRNEMSSQQSHQLQLQRDIILEKKAELRELNNRMNELGNALKNQNNQPGNQKEIDVSKDNQQLRFNDTYLQDTLNRKRSVGNKPNVVDINSNIVATEKESLNKNSVEQVSKTLSADTPLTLEEFKKNLSTFKLPKPLPPQRTTPVSIVEKKEIPIYTTKNNEENITLLRQDIKGELLEDKKSINTTPLNSLTNSTPYSDLSLSFDSDKIVIKSNDSALNSITNKSDDSSKPLILVKPTLSVKPMMENNNLDKIDDSIAAYYVKPSNDITVSEYDKEIFIPQPDYPNDFPSEPDGFELSFADIDEINETQTDLWTGSLIPQSPYDSESDDFENVPVPLIISLPPEKMPPPILMKPDKPRKPKRKLVLDPFALLLDSALEGELGLVKEILNQVPNPSRANPEGITALHNAVCGNHKDVVRFLVEVGCDINSADNNGWTPLHCAAFYNDTELCRFLVEHGASVFAMTYTDYQTPAHKCSQLDDNYDNCFGYLHECKENVGRINGGLVHALFDYTAESDDELSFYCGDTLTVLKRGDNNEKEWWWCRNKNGEVGYVACNLVGNFPRIAAEV
ncbi:apoptotic enhancer 1 protein isoform X2 [Hydra vulgaris]|uniref:Apoptotic enhancer 1 protein isoform X2 n=1 Tax=Hydra vulgaris TaxID=6087 RepID=A0ABM4C4V4_HYDVU